MLDYVAKQANIPSFCQPAAYDRMRGWGKFLSHTHKYCSTRNIEEGSICNKVDSYAYEGGVVWFRKSRI
jgi:hypothetical protein